jgi:putative membrane protein insertion efficiency factor
MIKRALLAGIRFYSRAISPALPPRCRFYPTCSAYAAEAVERHGAARGTWLAVRRLVKCAPWHPGGVDLVPDVPAGRGTTRPGHTSSTAASPSPADRAVTPDARRPDRAIPPDTRRANEESSVA